MSAREVQEDEPLKDVTSGAVISISSHVMRGSVGNRAAAFALETLGHPVWSVPTIVMPWHPGQGRSTRMRLDPEGFSSALEELSGARWREEVRAVLTGYFADAAQVRAAAALVSSFRERDPGFLYLCDPVIGDSGGLYVPLDVAEAIRDELLPLASIATPNRFELAWLSGLPVDSNAEILSAAERLACGQLIVTSAHAMMASSIANLLIADGRALMAEHRTLDNAPNGLGDLLSALYLSRVMGGVAPSEALRLAVSSIFEIAARSVKAGSDELLLEQEAASMKTPMAMVSLREILGAGMVRRAHGRVAQSAHDPD